MEPGNVILELFVQTNPERIVELESELGAVRMIPFSGAATGPLFQGIIEPCGVDTQITNAANVRHMSARYMLPVSIIPVHPATFIFRTRRGLPTV